MLFLKTVDFVFLKKAFSQIPSERQTFWIRMSPNCLQMSRDLHAILTGKEVIVSRQLYMYAG